MPDSASFPLPLPLPPPLQQWRRMSRSAMSHTREQRGETNELFFTQRGKLVRRPSCFYTHGTNGRWSVRRPRHQLTRTLLRQFHFGLGRASPRLRQPADQLQAIQQQAPEPTISKPSGPSDSHWKFNANGRRATRNHPTRPTSCIAQLTRSADAQLDIAEGCTRHTKQGREQTCLQ